MAPRTVQNYAMATDQVGCDVDVWVNELDDVRRGTLESYSAREFPVYVVRLHATAWEPEQRVYMDQGPYTESGSHRVVAVYLPNGEPDMRYT